MNPRLTWTTPPSQSYGCYASWDGGPPFASLHPAAPVRGAWTLCLYPSHHTGVGKNYYAGSEAEAKRWVARWVEHH